MTGWVTGRLAAQFFFRFFQILFLSKFGPFAGDGGRHGRLTAKKKHFNLILLGGPFAGDGGRHGRLAAQYHP